MKHASFYFCWTPVYFFVCIVLSRKTVLNQSLQDLFLCFFQEFYTFKTYICLWSILSYFLCMMWSRDSASFFHMWAIQHCWKNFSFSIDSLGMLSCQINWLYMWVCFWTPSSIPLIYICLVLQPICNSCIIVLINFAFFFCKVILAILGPLHFHMNFRITLSVFNKKPAVILMGKSCNLKFEL